MKYTVIENGYTEDMTEVYHDEFYYDSLSEAYEHFGEFPNKHCTMAGSNYIWIWGEESQDPIDCAKHWI